MNRSDDYRPTALVCPFGDHEGRGLCDMAIQQEIELYKTLQMVRRTEAGSPASDYFAPGETVTMTRRYRVSGGVPRSVTARMKCA